MTDRLDVASFAKALDALLGSSTITGIAVAVSGGADSTCLAILLKNWADQRKIPLTALTVDHHLRPESSAEANDTKQVMEEAGINHHTLLWQHKGLTTKIQESAREARYELLLQYCLQHHISHLFLAQHADDQAETFLYRLSRSSGTDGLGCMRSLSLRQGIYIVRPLLNIPKRALEDYLQEKGLPWSQDPSNENLRFTRVKIRRFMPCLQEIGIQPHTLTAVTRKLQRSRDALEFYTKAFLAQYATLSELGYVALQIPDKWPPEDVILRGLSWILWHVSGFLYPPRQGHVESLYGRIISGHFKAITCAGCYITPLKGSLIFMREHKHLSTHIIQTNGLIRWDNRFEIHLSSSFLPLALGPVGPSKALAALHPAVPSYVLAGLPALKDGKEIIAVPCLNYYPNPDKFGRKSIIDWCLNPRKNLFQVLFTIA